MAIRAKIPRNVPATAPAPTSRATESLSDIVEGSLLGHNVQIEGRAAFGASCSNAMLGVRLHATHLGYFCRAYETISRTADFVLRAHLSNLIFPISALLLVARSMLHASTISFLLTFQ